MTEKRQVEVLAPAGSYESMEAAFAAGADAVYIGGSRFGARAYADNPDEEMLCRAIDYAHLHGRQLYMTVNTLFKEEELKELPAYLLPYYRRGLDAVIVQDLGAMALIRECFPDLFIHASTQMTITGVYGAKRLKEWGANRVVTARELSLEEIRRIHHQVDIEIESFVHGALCYCYSGQCLMSSLIGRRSGNRGRCAQPCRLPYGVLLKGKKLNKKQEAFVLSMKDLCTLDLLPDIIEAGVYSLKIEGRMKSPRYTAGVTSVYRKYVDRYLQYGREDYQVEEQDRQMLLDLFDRGGFTEGYYTQHNGKSMLALKEKPAFREVDPKLLAEIDQKWVKKKLQEPIAGCLTLTPGEAARLVLTGKAENDKEIKAEIYGQEVQAAQKQPMTKEIIIRQFNKTGNTPFYFSQLDIVLHGDVFLPLQALNELRRKGLEEMENQVLSRCLRKGSTDRGLNQSTGESIDENTVQGSEIKELGNTEREGRGSERCADRDESGFAAKEERKIKTSRPYFVVSVEEPDQLLPVLYCEEVKEIYLDASGFGAEGWKEMVNSCHRKGKRCFLLMPEIFRQEAVQYFAKNRNFLFAAGFDGLVLRSLEEAEWVKAQREKVWGKSQEEAEQGKAQREKEAGKLQEVKKWAGEQEEKERIKEPQEEKKTWTLVFDASLYSWNFRAVQMMREAGADRISVPTELNARELRERGIEGQELLVYGRLPMMVSAQCVQKTVQGCSHKPSKLHLKDRTGKEMPVKNRCRFCYSTIYNASPLSLLGQERVIGELNPASCRLHFTDETPKEVEKLLKAFIDGLYYGRTADFPLAEFTRGHMKRGVE